MFMVRSYELSKVYFPLVAVVKLPRLMAVSPRYTSCLTDLFLLENPFFNSQVTKRIQCAALSTRALEQ